MCGCTFVGPTTSFPLSPNTSEGLRYAVKLRSVANADLATALPLSTPPEQKALGVVSLLGPPWTTPADFSWILATLLCCQGRDDNPSGPQTL